MDAAGSLDSSGRDLDPDNTSPSEERQVNYLNDGAQTISTVLDSPLDIMSTKPCSYKLNELSKDCIDDLKISPMIIHTPIAPTKSLDKIPEKENVKVLEEAHLTYNKEYSESTVHSDDSKLSEPELLSKSNVNKHNIPTRQITTELTIESKETGDKMENAQADMYLNAQAECQINELCTGKRSKVENAEPSVKHAVPTDDVHNEAQVDLNNKLEDIRKSSPKSRRKVRSKINSKNNNTANTIGKSTVEVNTTVKDNPPSQAEAPTHDESELDQKSKTEILQTSPLKHHQQCSPTGIQSRKSSSKLDRKSSPVNNRLSSPIHKRTPILDNKWSNACNIKASPISNETSSPTLDRKYSQSLEKAASPLIDRRKSSPALKKKRSSKKTNIELDNVVISKSKPKNTKSTENAESILKHVDEETNNKMSDNKLSINIDERTMPLADTSTQNLERELVLTESRSVKSICKSIVNTTTLQPKSKMSDKAAIKVRDTSGEPKSTPNLDVEPVTAESKQKVIVNTTTVQPKSKMSDKAAIKVKDTSGEPKSTPNLDVEPVTAESKQKVKSKTNEVNDSKTQKKVENVGTVLQPKDEATDNNDVTIKVEGRTLLMDESKDSQKLEADPARTEIKRRVKSKTKVRESKKTEPETTATDVNTKTVISNSAVPDISTKSKIAPEIETEIISKIKAIFEQYSIDAKIVNTKDQPLKPQSRTQQEFGKHTSSSLSRARCQPQNTESKNNTESTQSAKSKIPVKNVEPKIQRNVENSKTKSETEQSVMSKIPIKHFESKVEPGAESHASSTALKQRGQPSGVQLQIQRETEQSATSKIPVKTREASKAQPTPTPSATRTAITTQSKSKIPVKVKGRNQVRVRRRPKLVQRPRVETPTDFAREVVRQVGLQQAVTAVSCTARLIASYLQPDAGEQEEIWGQIYTDSEVDDDVGNVDVQSIGSSIGVISDNF